MRDAPFLHAKHLDEAVRRGVITSDQREALAALARTLRAEEERALPEMGWFRWMLAAVTAAAVGLPGLIALASTGAMEAHEFVAAGLLGVGVTAGGAFALRDRREHGMVKGVLAAAATSFAWLLGAGAALAAFGVDTAGGAHTAQERLPLWTVPAGLVVLAAAGAFGRALRAPTVALPAAVALAHVTLRVGLWCNVGAPYQAGANVAWSDGAQLPWWLGASLALTVAARLLDRRFARHADPGFWVHLAAPAPALVGLLDCVEHAPGALIVLVTALWCGAFGLAFAWRRITWVAWGAVGLAAIPLVALPTRSSPIVPALWVPLCAAAFAFAAMRWRRQELAAATPDDAERSPWA